MVIEMSPPATQGTTSTGSPKTTWQRLSARASQGSPGAPTAPSAVAVVVGCAWSEGSGVPARPSVFGSDLAVELQADRARVVVQGKAVCPVRVGRQKQDPFMTSSDVESSCGAMAPIRSEPGACYAWEWR